MATVTLRPNSDETNTSDASHITKSTGSTFYGCVDESTLDTGDYLTFDATGGFWATFGFTDCGLTDETINSVTIYAYADNDYGCPHFYCNDDELWNTTQVSGKLYKYTLTKNGGNDWTASTVDSLKAGFAPSSDPDMKETTNLYQVYVVVDYTAGEGEAQNLTLTCAAGSYSLTGTSVTLTHTPASQNLTLTCNAGSYSLTGTNADLTVTRHYTLTCEAGSYALTGSIVDLTVQHNYVLVCGAGSYSLTGTNADLTVKRNYVLVCGAGSYALTGQTLTLSAGRKLAVDAGTFSLTGMDAALNVGYKLNAESGTYELTGIDIELKAARKLSLGTGNYLKTLDYQYFGQPFCWLSLETTLDTDTLDYNYFGQPFWAVMPSGEEPPPPTGLSKQFMYYARQRGNLC